jgi:hypothetical protein
VHIIFSEGAGTYTRFSPKYIKHLEKQYKTNSLLIPDVYFQYHIQRGRYHRCIDTFKMCFHNTASAAILCCCWGRGVFRKLSNARGADKSLALYRKQQATGLKECIYSTYSLLCSTHLWLHFSNFFNPSKKNSFGYAANRKNQRLISTPTYVRVSSIMLLGYILKYIALYTETCREEILL